MAAWEDEYAEYTDDVDTFDGFSLFVIGFVFAALVLWGLANS